MAVLRTKRLALGWLSGALDPEERVSQLVYTVPSGHRAVIRDWRVVYQGIPVQGGGCYLVVISGGFTAYVAAAATSPAKLQYGELCQIVLNAGDELFIESFQGPDAHYCVSGAELLDGQAAP